MFETKEYYNIEVIKIILKRLCMLDLNFHAKEFLVEEELSQGSVAVHHLLEGGSLAGQVALALVLFLQEFTSQIVHKL